MGRLSRACYTVKSLRPFVSHESLMMIYFYFHAVMSYGIIFLENTLCGNNIFTLQKRDVKIITNSRNRDSYKELFKKLDILPFYSWYIFSLLIFVTDNISLFKIKLDLHDIHTRGKNYFHLSQPRLSVYINSVYYMGIKTFNHLPSYIKEIVR
jgi:hypothetical protein